MELILVQMLIMSLDSLMGKYLTEHLGIWLGYIWMTGWNLSGLQISLYNWIVG